MSSIKNRLIAFIENDLKGNSQKIEANTSLFKEGILTSLDLVALLDFIEKEFKVTVPSGDVDFEYFDTVEKLEKYLESKIVK